MRRIICFLLVSMSVSLSMAQCVPNLGGPHFEAEPDTLVNLPTAYYTSAYEATVQMYIPTDTFVDMLNLVLPLDSLFITGIDGLPPSFEYQVYPTAGPIPGGTPICLQITNNLVYQKLEGSYPLFIHVEAWSVGIPAHGDITGYVLNVEPSLVGIGEEQTNIMRSNILTDKLQLNVAHSGPLAIYNIEGQMVWQQSTGVTTVLDVAFLPEGMYLLRTESGSARFLKVSP
ncbi:MAG: hypothetical protein RL266_22 [Bacteroidota bacterium]|jgi:hypothetical protein